jgi:hypothetical protein
MAFRRFGFRQYWYWKINTASTSVIWTSTSVIWTSTSVAHRWFMNRDRNRFWFGNNDRNTHTTSAIVTRFTASKTSWERDLDNGIDHFTFFEVFIASI